MRSGSSRSSVSAGVWMTEPTSWWMSPDVIARQGTPRMANTMWSLWGHGSVSARSGQPAIAARTFAAQSSAQLKKATVVGASRRPMPSMLTSRAMRPNSPPQPAM